jgi:hypothetical protein
MEHEAVVANRAVERYILGEMPAEERDLFEEHYFSCGDCAEDVRHASSFVANAKAVWRDEANRNRVEARHTPQERRPWFWWLQPSWGPALAAVLLAFTGYQSLVTVPALRREAAGAMQPRQVAAFVLRADSRGAAKVVEAPPSEPLLLTLDLNPPQTFPKYIAEIHDASGAVVSTIGVAPPAPDEPLNLYIPNPKLPAGQYTLMIRGDTGSQQGPEVGRYRFELQRK